MTAERLAARRETIAASPDLSRLLARLVERAEPMLERRPSIPAAKALLSVDGGVCPADHTALRYDPWSPSAHVCPRCGASYAGERHDRWWARFQHLWLGERAAHLAAIAAFAGHDAAAARARELLAHYADHYVDYPNRDNVLGPSRLFFSTYLESIWLTNYLAAALLLRESGQLDRAGADGVSRVADEAANLIGEFDEGFSNRQTWNTAALAAIAVWFEDEELLGRAVEGPTGLISHLLQGFGRDGMWFEGENYHLFALRGLLVGLDWVRAAGVDPQEEPELRARVRAALAAPALTALPDLTFPARKDSRFGTSLAQPMYLELWEAGRRAGEPGEGLDDWLAALYAAPGPAAEPFDSYLHEAGDPPPAGRGRQDLSWWMLLAMAPTLAGDPAGWRPGSRLMESQGLAILRTGNRYASLETGAYGGGHGHPDRLQLTLYERGVHWLPDFGAGSYVSRDLFWSRSTLAHNAPLLDGVSQRLGDAVPEYFDVKGGWSWVRGRFGPVTRTLVSGPDYLLDVVELASDEDRRLELPWHLAGRLEVPGAARWEPATLAGELVTGAERHLLAPVDRAVVVAARDEVGRALALTARGATEIIRATAPGAPGTGPSQFVVLAGRGRVVRFVSVLAPAPVELTVDGEVIGVTTPGGTDRHHTIVEGWEVRPASGEPVRLAGPRPEPRVFEPLVTREVPLRQTGVAVRVGARPMLDGTLDGFDDSQPLALDHEDQYRRSEEPYSGPDDFAAVAYANWDDDALYLALDVAKPEVVLRPADAEPLLLDNEPDDIHSDGLQVYVRLAPDEDPYGFLIVPDPGDGTIRVRTASGCTGDPGTVSGSWAATDSGYVVTLALEPPGWNTRTFGDRIGFDLLVNEMLPDRERRAGQLVWSGGGGWVWLRGDRQDPGRFGELELA
ncbi:MAG TPA: heparinase II/III family protein [Gemmatimonadales bacterium]